MYCYVYISPLFFYRASDPGDSDICLNLGQDNFHCLAFLSMHLSCHPNKTSSRTLPLTVTAIIVQDSPCKPRVCLSSPRRAHDGPSRWAFCCGPSRRNSITNHCQIARSARHTHDNLLKYLQWTLTRSMVYSLRIIQKNFFKSSL